MQEADRWLQDLSMDSKFDTEWSFLTELTARGRRAAGEWLALLDPATERTVAQIKLSWWHEEMSRLTRDAAVHPVSRYLARQPGADPAHFSILIQAVEAAMVELGGAPLTLAQPLAGQPLAGQPLASQSTALLAGPLRVASRLACQQPDGPEPVGPEPVGPALAGAALDRGTQSLAIYRAP